MTSRVPLERVEFVQNGRVIETRDVDDGQTSVRLEKEVTVKSSSWFAARVTGAAARGIIGPARAHSGAIYILVDGRPVLFRKDLELMIQWVDRLWAYLEERDNFGPGDNRQRALAMFEQARKHYEDKLARIR